MVAKRRQPIYRTKPAAKGPMERVTDERERAAIFDAIDKLDPRLAPEWKELAKLVPGAKVDTVEAAGMYKSGDAFEVSATVYVTIPLDGRASTESFSANIAGRLVKGKAQIKAFSVNTSSFFGGEAYPWQTKLS